MVERESHAESVTARIVRPGAITEVVGRLSSGRTSLLLACLRDHTRAGAVVALVDAQRQILLQRETVATATENRRIVQAGYVAGKEPLTRLNETQRDYIAAEANLALARIRLRQAWSDLESAVGYPPTVSEPVPGP